MGDLEKFTEFLYEGLTGYVYTPIKKKDNSWEQYFFQWPQQKQELHDFITTSKRDGDVYISPSIFSEKSSKKAAVKATRVAWVEFDGNAKDFRELPEPNMIVQSSTEDHLHCYWRIEETTGPVVEEINRRLTYYLEADSSGWDCSQVLRAPTTLNWKQKVQPKEVKLLKCLEGKNEFSLFDKAPEVKHPVAVLEYGDLLDPKTIEITNKDLEALVNTRVPGPNQRSSLLMFAAHALAEFGYSHLEIVSLLYHIDYRIKKFVGRADQLVRLSEIASIAVLKFERDNYVESYSPLEIINHELSLDWYFPGWLHSTGLMLLSGQPGVGKTQFSLDLGYRFATGGELLGKPGRSPLRVTMISGEMDIVELKYIFEHQRKDFTELSLWNQNLRVYAPEEMGLAKIEHIIKESTPHVVIIDSLSEIATDDLKESEARAIMKKLRSLKREYNCAFIIIHHNRKANDSNKKPRKLSDLYGSYIFGKLSETVISLWQEDGKNYIEVDVFKSRFGSRAPLRIKRSENLTFSLEQEVVEIVDTTNPFLADDPLRNGVGELPKSSGSN